MEHQLSLDFYRQQLKSTKHDKIMQFDLLEKLLIKNKLQRYLDVKKKIKNSINAQLRGFDHLFSDLLQDKISDLDIEIYCNNFEPNQNIKYFREYFNNTKETENYSHKGTIIELKAYGDSKKINREVIAFTGNFKDNLLHSFSDKTSEAQYFVDKETEDIDYYENDINLIKLLLEKDLIEVLSESSLNSILIKNASAFFILYNANKHGLVNSQTLNQLARYSTEVFEFLLRKRQLNLLSNETIKYQVDKEPNEIYSKASAVLNHAKKLAFMYDKQDRFYLKKSELPKPIQIGENHRFENDYNTYLKVDEMIETFEYNLKLKSYNKNRNNITEEDRNYLNSLYQSEIDSKIVSEIVQIKNTIKERIKLAKKENNSNTRTGCITIVIIAIALFLIWNWLTK